MSYSSRSGSGYGNQRHRSSGWRGSGKAKRDTLLAKKSFEGRSKRSQAQDLHKYAEIAPNIVAYLHSPSTSDWRGVDTPSKIAELTKKGKVEMTIKDGSAKDKPKTHRYKVVKKTEQKAEDETTKVLAKAEANNPLLGSGHKLPSEKEILAKAQALYMAENFKAAYADSTPETLPTKGELAEEGFLQKAKTLLMTSQDTQASRQTLDYVDNLRQQLEKIGFTVEPIAGFDSSDLNY